MPEVYDAHSGEDILVQVQNLTKTFGSGAEKLYALDDVSFSIRRGETFGLVGESGCGKTTCGRVIVRLLQPDGGSVRFEGQDIHRLRGQESKNYTRKVQMIFQDPYASLNPRMTIGDIIKEGMRIHRMGSEAEITDRMHELLEQVGLNREHASRFPYEFSGGQRQRAGIARALAVNPSFLVCDEPISALDVSIQAQIVNLLRSLQKQLNITSLFIAHDLSMVRYISDRVAVMYLGRIVESAEAEELYSSAVHPYTRALLSAIPEPQVQDREVCENSILQGDVPSPIGRAQGCSFAPRCPYATPACFSHIPVQETVSPGHTVACHRWKELLENDYGKNDPNCFFCDVRQEAGVNLNRVRNKNSVRFPK
ncbi:MAG: ATP-binding cassette domain-containing protein [Clostridia bacterium]|nr:ATP-binding cassette domain-containing protein [Clostridia bacterium]